MSSMPAAYPRAWARRLNELSGTAALDVAGLTVHVEITAQRLKIAYLPVLAALVSRSESLELEGEGGPGRRLLAGLAGIGAGGKSTFAAVLGYLAERLLPAAQFVVVGMDGWHYRNAILDERWTVDAAGRRMPLRRRKGGPESYDVEALVAAMTALRMGGKQVSLPAYDRRLHEPVADAVQVPAEARIVLLEGNYLLSDTPPWDEVSGLLDLKFFLECELAGARQRMIARHIRGGLTEEQARRKFEENDGPNAALIAATARRADYVVRM